MRARGPSAGAPRLGVPRRIVTLVEGGGLINDATALVAYNFAVAAVVTGSFSLLEASGDFVLNAVGGIALSHLPGLPMIAGAAMGIGAMTVVMLGLPLTSVLLTMVFLQSDGLALTPLVIVAVVVAYVASKRIEPDQVAETAPPPAGAHPR